MSYNYANFCSVVSHTKQVISNNVKLLLSIFTNFTAKGARVTNIAHVAPYGVGGISNINQNAMIMPMYGTNQHAVCLGYMVIIPDVPHEYVNGESWIHSNKYVLSLLNDSIKAFRITDQNYNATLCNGEFMGQMMLNRINEMQAEINYLKNHTHVAGSLQAPNGAVTGATGAPTSPPPSPSTLSTDANYITNGNYLINDNGTMYG